MIIRNRTPFSHALLAGQDRTGTSFLSLVLRGTFCIVPQAPLELHPEQERVVARDVHFDDGDSSLRFESDRVPFKARADVHVHAVARAPGGWPTPSWTVGVRVGALERRLRVTGPRHWVRQGRGFRLEEPAPCAAIPIRYEHAFGGVWSALGERRVFAENPVGIGYVPAGCAPPAPRWPAPRIESLDDPIEELGRSHAPQGFGPVARTWQPRRDLAGTYDERWRRERWPHRLPDDFLFEHYQSAHPSMRYDGFLAGDEPVELDGMDPRGPLRFHLPGVGVLAVLRYESGAIEARRARLDTLIVDLLDGKARLVWRALVARRRPLRALELHVTPLAAEAA